MNAPGRPLLPPLFWLIVLAGVAPLRAAEPPAAKEFFRQPAVHQASLSPDGRTLLFLTASGRKYFDLAAVDTETMAATTFNMAGEDIFDFDWLDDHHVLLTSQNLPQYRWRQTIFDLQKHKIAHNVSYEDLRFDLISSLDDQPGKFYAFFGEADGGARGLALIDAHRKPGSIAGIRQDRFNVVDWVKLPPGEYHGAVPDPSGELRIAVMYSDRKLHYHYRSSAKAAWRELPLDPELTEIVSIDPKADTLWVAHLEDGKPAHALFRYDAAAGKFLEQVHADPAYALADARILRVPDTYKPLAVTFTRERAEQVYLDDRAREVAAAARQKLGALPFLIADCDREERRFLLFVPSERNPGRYLLYDRKTQKLQALPDPWPYPTTAAMRPTQSVKFKARDGLELQGYLTLPAAAPGRARPPLVVLCHGGPWARDTWGFDRQVQFLATRGYAVFQPNYRGSTGFTRAVSVDPEFAFREMHRDVTDATHQLQASGLIDPQRIAIMGGSFGGYLTLCGLAFEPGLYRCGVTLVGVFDWEAIVAQRGRNRYDRFNKEVLIDKLGNPRKKEELFREISPIHHLDNVKAPVFIYHGLWDDRVDSSQSAQLKRELERRNIPVEYFIMHDEGHSLSEYDNQVKVFTAIEDFLAAHLAAPAQP